MPALKAANVLLREARNLSNLLLRQAPLLPNASKISSHEPPHVHAKVIAIRGAQVYQL